MLMQITNTFSAIKLLLKSTKLIAIYIKEFLDTWKELLQITPRKHIIK
jgi:hypothetical protein